MDPLRTSIQIKRNGVYLDPTGYTVEFAFTTNANLANAVWYAGEWETVENHYWAVFNNTAVIPKGHWRVWVRIVSAPETPIRAAGEVWKL